MNGTLDPAFRSAVAPFFRRIVRTVRDTVVKRAVARALSAMDDRTLAELGVGHSDVLYPSAMAARALAETDDATVKRACGKLPGRHRSCGREVGCTELGPPPAA